MEERVKLKKRIWGTLIGAWAPHDTRGAVVDFVKLWTGKTDILLAFFISWLAIAKSKFYTWQKRYGKANEYIFV